MLVALLPVVTESLLVPHAHARTHTQVHTPPSTWYSAYNAETNTARGTFFHAQACTF